MSQRIVTFSIGWVVATAGFSLLTSWQFALGISAVFFGVFTVIGSLTGDDKEAPK